MWAGDIGSIRCERCYNLIPADDGSTSMVMWSDGRYVIRYVSKDNFGILYLWDRLVPVSTMYMHELCRKNGVTVEEIIKSVSDKSREADWMELSREMMAAENGYMIYIDYFMKRLSLSYDDAKLLAIHFTGMGPEAIAIKFGLPLESVRHSFDVIMKAYSDCGIVVDDTIFTENPFKYYGN